MLSAAANVTDTPRNIYLASEGCSCSALLVGSPCCAWGRALALSADRAFSARDLYSKALKDGNQDLTTYTYLATALNHIDHGQEAETVLERAIATYPYAASLRIALARPYLHDNKGWRARFVLNEYLKLFPEESAVRNVLYEVLVAGQ